MRLLKIGMTALVAVCAVLTGLLIAAVAAIAGTMLFFSKRSRSETASRRTGDFPSRARTRPLKMDGSDVIDVDATEVSSGPARREPSPSR